MSKKKKLKFQIFGVVILAILAIVKLIMIFMEPHRETHITPLKKLGNPTNKRNDRKKISRSKNYSFAEGDFTLDVNLPLNQTVTVKYIVPIDPKTGKANNSANNIVYYALCLGSAERLKIAFEPWHRYYAEKYGCTIFTLVIKSEAKYKNNKSIYYIYKESGWFEVVFKAEEYLAKKFNLKPKPLLIFGNSAGGSMAQRLSAAYPNKIDAVTWCGGASYNLSYNFNVPSLALSVWGCNGAATTQHLGAKANNTISAYTPPTWRGKRIDHHGPGLVAYTMMKAYIRDIIRLRNNNNGKLPLCEKWPVKLKVNNREIFFPSKELAELWQSLPHRFFIDKKKKVKDYFLFRNRKKAKKIVLLVNDSSCQGKIMLEDSLYFLDKNNCLAIAIEGGEYPVDDMVRLERALKQILSKKEWASYDVCIGGRGVCGRLAAIVAFKNSNFRIKKISIFDYDHMLSLSELSILKYRSRSNIPLEIYSTQKQTNILPNTKYIKLTKSPDDYQQWFNYLSSLVEVKKQKMLAIFPNYYRKNKSGKIVLHDFYVTK